MGKMAPEERQDRLFGLSAFFRGEACVTDTLSPYITAMPDEEMRISVATQLVGQLANKLPLKKQCLSLASLITMATQLRVDPLGILQ